MSILFNAALATQWLAEDVAQFDGVASESRRYLGTFTNLAGDECQIQMLITRDDYDFINVFDMTRVAVQIGDQVEALPKNPAQAFVDEIANHCDAMGYHSITINQLKEEAERFAKKQQEVED